MQTFLILGNSLLENFILKYLQIMKKITLLFFSLMLFCMLSAQQSSVSFEQWISLKQASSPVISPDGAWVIYTVVSTDWAANQYDAEIWIAKTSEPKNTFQLTRTSKGSSTNAKFSPDSKWISFVADRGNKKQLYIISPKGGEALPITNEEEGIDDYKWSYDGKQIAFTKTDADSKKEKNTTERYGGFEVEDEGFKQNSLWVANFNYDSITMAVICLAIPQKKTAVKMIRQKHAT